MLDIEEYRKLSGKETSIVDLLSYPGAGEIDFDPPRMGAHPYRPLDLFD